MRNSDSEEKELTRAKNAAYRYLSYRPRTRAEIERKLAEKNFSSRLIQSVLHDLDRLGYLDDRDFARQWAGSRVRLRGFGRRRIEQELKEKGVSRDVLQEALSGIFSDISEIEIAQREANKKLRTLTGLEPEVRRRRLAGFLERKGFRSETIRSVLADIRNAVPRSANATEPRHDDPGSSVIS